jgi:hypothetical protein
VRDVEKTEIPNWIGLSFLPCEEELSSHERLVMGYNIFRSMTEPFVHILF